MPLLEAVRVAFQVLRAQKLKSSFSLIGVFIGVTFLVAAWSIVNGMNRYMTEKFAGRLIGVNTFHLRRRPDVAVDVPDSLWRVWRRRPRVTLEDATAGGRGLTLPVLTSWFSEVRGPAGYGRKAVKEADLQ